MVRLAAATSAGKPRRIRWSPVPLYHKLALDANHPPRGCAYKSCATHLALSSRVHPWRTPPLPPERHLRPVIASFSMAGPATRHGMTPASSLRGPSFGPKQSLSGHRETASLTLAVTARVSLVDLARLWPPIREERPSPRGETLSQRRGPLVLERPSRPREAQSPVGQTEPTLLTT